MTIPAHQQWGPQSSLDRVNAALAAQDLRPQHKTDFKALCPTHLDTTPSLHVTWRDGRVLLWCFGGCDTEDVLAALGLGESDLYDERLEPTPRPRVGRSPQQRRSGARRGRLGPLPKLLKPPGDESEDPEQVGPRELVDTYDYFNADGLLVKLKLRYEFMVGSVTKKTFIQQYAVADGWVDKKEKVADGYAEVLFRHPEALTAVAAGEPVWEPEGEKDVKAAESQGVVAYTCDSPGSFPEELNQLFTGADVRLVLDRDRAGWRRGIKRHEALTTVGADVRIFIPAVTAVKADLADHLAAGYGMDDLIEVTVDEIRTWHHLEDARERLRRVEQCLQQARLRLDAAATDEEGAPKRAGDHRRMAARWSAESELRLEPVTEAITATEAAAAVAGTPWASEAAAIAEDVGARARQTVLEVHELVGSPVPAHLRQSAAAPQAETREAAAPAPDPGTAAGRTPGPQTGDRLNRVRYRMINGMICERPRNGDVDDDDAWTPLLDLDVRITAWEYTETDDIDEADALGEIGVDRAQAGPGQLRTLTAVRFTWTHPASGEEMSARVPADEAEKLSWLDTLGLPLDWNRTARGRATLYGAMWSMASDAEEIVLHRATGWRHRPDGTAYYVHAAGGIDANGATPVEVQLRGSNSTYTFPAPTTDGQRIRAAFVDHSAGMLTAMPARIIAPLLGSVFRSVIGHNEWVLALVGTKGSFKTGLAALAMHHLGQRWDRHHPGVSMRGIGDTLTALRLKLHQCKDSLFWADDFAPTHGIAATQKALEDVVGLIHEKINRDRGTRDGQDHLPSTPPRASGLVTSEVMPRPGTSGGERMLAVPVLKGDLTRDAIVAFDSPDARYQRNLLMASMIQWIAGDLDGARRRANDEAAGFAGDLRDRGFEVRVADAVSSTWAGWTTLTDFLIDRAAIDDEERNVLLKHVRVALLETTSMTVDPDNPVGMAARIKELLRRILASSGHLVDARTGDAPEAWELASRMGWQRDKLGTSRLTADTEYRVSRVGAQIGFYLAENAEIGFDPAALDEALKAAAAKLSDAPQIDRRTALQELANAGAIATEPNGNGAPKKVVYRNLPHRGPGQRARLVVMKLAELFDDDPGIGDGATTPSWGGGPLPGLFDNDNASVQTGSVRGSSENPPRHVALAGDGESAHRDIYDSAEEERAMGTYADADGLLVAPTFVGESEPCVVCGNLAGAWFTGVACHIPCWTTSSASQRSQTMTPPPSAVPAAASSPARPLHEAKPSEGLAAQPAAPKRAAGAPAITDAQPFTAAAAVLDTDGVWLPDGTHKPLPWELKDVHAGQLAQLVYDLNLGVHVTKSHTEPGALWITSAACRDLGIDVDAITESTELAKGTREATANHRIVTEAVSAGWQVGAGGDSLGRWTRVWPADGGRMGARIGLVPAMDTHPRGEMPILGDDPSPASLAKRIGLLTSAIHTQFGSGNQATGIDLMKTLRSKDRHMFEPHEPCPPAMARGTEVDVSWTRAPDQHELELGHLLNGHDRGGSYLAGAGSCELGYGTPTHYPDGVDVFNPKEPGYHLIVIPEAGDYRLPHPLRVGMARVGERAWVTSIALAFAHELEYAPEILESYVWHQHTRILDPWYVRIRDGMYSLYEEAGGNVDMARARKQLKEIYVRTIGMLGSEEFARDAQTDALKDHFHPHWRHMLMSRSRINILRKAWSIGTTLNRWPVAMRRDTLYYISDTPGSAGWPGQAKDYGPRMGQYRWESTGLLADQMKYLDGGPYSGNRDMTGSLADAQLLVA